MQSDELKEQLVEVANYFYQERIEEGMSLFLGVVEKLVGIPEFASLLPPLFDAVEVKDYVLAADIFYHEMAMKMG